MAPPLPSLSRRALLALAGTSILAACRRAPKAVPLPSTTSPPPGPQVTLTVNGKAVSVPAPATVADALHAAKVSPKRGELLDIDGELLRRRGTPPLIRMSGDIAHEDDTVVDGAVITARDGRDQKEEIVVKEKKAGLPPNPEFLLGGTAATVTIKQGKVSGKVISAKYEEGRGEWRPKEIALTFDDGPDPRGTPAVLKVLRDERVTATFFVVGYKIEEHPDLIKAIVDEGHQIGNHSWSHPTGFSGLSGSALATEIRRPVELLNELGVETQWFRPPGGSWDEEVVATAEAAGMRTVMWSIGTGDFRSGIPPHHVEHTVEKRMKRGAIVLMHDGMPGAPQTTAKVLPDIIKDIRKAGYSLGVLEPNI